jgi:hypothetical protein
VTKVFLLTGSYRLTGEFTPEKNHLFVRNVEKDLQPREIYIHT